MFALEAYFAFVKKMVEAFEGAGLNLPSAAPTQIWLARQFWFGRLPCSRHLAAQPP